MRNRHTAIPRIVIATRIIKTQINADLRKSIYTDPRLSVVTAYGFEPLGLSWKKSGVRAAAPMPLKIAIVAGTPNPKSPPPPAAAAPAGAPAPAPAPAPAAAPCPTVGAAAPCGKQISRTPPAAGSVLPADPCSVATSPVVFFLAVRIAQPYTITAFTLPFSS